MAKRTHARAGIACHALLALLTVATPGQTQPAADFYRGRTVHLLIGYTAGGNYDLNARVLARHIGRHIPGNPSIVPQNMAGAGSLRLANFLYNVAPKDGTVFGMIGRGVPMEPLLGSGATSSTPGATPGSAASATKPRCARSGTPPR
ncbi:MAG: hypothetical protein ACRECO_05490 [Xanthobacteraceae bacterium]